MKSRAASAVTAAFLALAAPAAAQSAKPADVTRIENAVVELAMQKSGAAGQVSARRRAAQAALGACRTKGPGWTRIRKVRDRAQRDAYARGARALWNGLNEVAARAPGSRCTRPSSSAS